MNKTIISIELQDYSDKKATIIVKGERNNQILFEEQIYYKNEEKHSIVFSDCKSERTKIRKDKVIIHKKAVI